LLLERLPLTWVENVRLKLSVPLKADLGVLAIFLATETNPAISSALSDIATSIDIDFALMLGAVFFPIRRGGSLRGISR
jgi:hypothetical protein